MNVNNRKEIQVDHQDNIINLNYVKEPNSNDPHNMGRIFVNQLAPAERNAVFHITSTMLQYLQQKGLFTGLIHEDTHEHIIIFVNVCEPYSFKIISQESV